MPSPFAGMDPYLEGEMWLVGVDAGRQPLDVAARYTSKFYV